MYSSSFPCAAPASCTFSDPRPPQHTLGLGGGGGGDWPPRELTRTDSEACN